MVQPLRNTSDGTSLARRSVLGIDSESFGSQVDTLKVVFCPVCRAVYVPSAQQQEIMRNSSLRLEAAFLHVCHFCFRCQRPACPQCWSQEYSLCALCGEAAHLPFRSPLSSFEGLIFSPPAYPQITSKGHMSFVCLRNGRFYASDRVSSKSTSATFVTPSRLLGKQEASVVSSSGYPDWLQEIMGQKPSRGDVKACQKAGEFADLKNVSAASCRDSLESAQTSPLSPRLLEKPTEMEKGIVVETSLPRVNRTKKIFSLVGEIDNILIFITSLILATLVIMIVSAIISPDMNMLFFRFTHIDIRAEIAYLLQLI
jgi:hypothetical protein